MIDLDALPKRLAAMIEQQPDDGCWLWTGSLNVQGYGQAHYVIVVGGRRQWLAHRLVFTLLGGVVGDYQQLHHKCHQRRCVRPSHLQPIDPTGHAQHHNPRPIICSAGHEYTPENTYVRRDDGSRQCRACKAERQRARYAAMAPDKRREEIARRTERRRRSRQSA